jgi:hypothetical protein
MIKNNLTLALFSILSILIVAVLTLNSVYAQENTTGSATPKFFAIQHAQSGSISEINQTFTLALSNESNKTMFSSDIDKTLTLELNNVSDKTILFSDRPDRIVTAVSTADFIGNWTAGGEDSFAVDAPNAVLVVDEKEVQQDTIIVELFNPIYDSNKQILKYDISPDDATSINISSKFGKATLFIDTGSNQGLVAELIALGGNG